MNVTIIGLDQAKEVFQVHGVDEHGVAVGMAVTRHPPHRFGRALLTHPAPTSSPTVKSLIWVRMHYSWARDPQSQVSL